MISSRILLWECESDSDLAMKMITDVYLSFPLW